MEQRSWTRPGRRSKTRGTLRFIVAAALASLFFVGSVGQAAVQTLQSFDGNTGWINSPPLTLESLQGKVVLVDFWEYTCINCLRTLPYLKTWYERYHQYGFEIIGVHTNEFQFSGEASNVEAASKRLGVTWPVVLDTNNVIWNRYHNDSWPHEFLAGPDGRIVEDKIGEGGYQDTERKIQALIRQQNPSVKLPEPMALLPQDSYDKPGAVCYPQTAEVFLSPHHQGAVRNPQGYNVGNVVNYTDSGKNHGDGFVYLSGPWFDEDEAVVHARNDPQASDYLDLPYHGIQVVAVLKPETNTVTVYVNQDGKPLAQRDAGSDIRFDSSGRSYMVVDAPRAYDIVMNRYYGKHELQLSPVQYGLGVYSFDFESCEVGADR